MKLYRNSYLSLFAAFVSLLALNMTASAEPEEKGMIGRVMIDGFPVIYKYVDEPPRDETRARYPWLTVIAWQYDAAGNNGMPDAALAERMVELERSLERLIDDGLSIHAYSRTGKELKELVYYIRDRDEYIDALNDTLSGSPQYPISINFYEDESWEDFDKIRSLFKPAPKGD